MPRETKQLTLAQLVQFQVEVKLSLVSNPSCLTLRELSAYIERMITIRSNHCFTCHSKHAFQSYDSID